MWLYNNPFIKGTSDDDFQCAVEPEMTEADLKKKKKKKRKRKHPVTAFNERDPWKSSSESRYAICSVNK